MESFPSDFARRIGIDNGSVDEVLEMLSEYVWGQVLDDGRCHIPGLGSFYMVDGKKLFEPAAELSRVVNHNYAGLNVMAVEESGSHVLVDVDYDGTPSEDFEPRWEEKSFADDDADDVSSVDSPIKLTEEKFGEPVDSFVVGDEVADTGNSFLDIDLDDTASTPDTVGEASHDASAEASPEVPTDTTASSIDKDAEGNTVDRGGDVVKGIASGMASVPDEVTDDSVDVASEKKDISDVVESTTDEVAADAPEGTVASDDSSGQPAEDSIEKTGVDVGAKGDTAEGSAEGSDDSTRLEDETGDDEKLVIPVDENAEPVVARGKPRASIWFYVLPILAMAFLLIAIYWAQTRQRTPRPIVPDTPAISNESGNATTGDQTDAAPGEAGDEAGATGDAQVDNQGVPAEPSWQPGGIDLSAGGWSIIVSSKPTRAEAETIAAGIAEGLGESSHAVDVIASTVNGQTRYRVAVGQFRTSTQTTREIRRLGDQLPDGSWALPLNSNQ